MLALFENLLIAAILHAVRLNAEQAANDLQIILHPMVQLAVENFFFFDRVFGISERLPQIRFRLQ